MAKRKITVTVDEELLDILQNEGGNLSALVNAALTEHADRLGRLASLRELLDEWEAVAGSPSAEAQAEAAAAFDEAEVAHTRWVLR
jgi:hypothetical protein